MGRVSSESGVQQGDPLGPLRFALVLQKIISAVDRHLIEELGPPFGIFINLAKCELFSRNELSSTFPVMIKSSQVPHFEILGGPHW